MRDSILHILTNAHGYVSGQSLCEQLGVSPTAIWNVIQKLKEDGYNIKAVSNKGYCLKQVPDKIEPYIFQYERKTKWLGKNIICLKEVSSTNTYAKELGDCKDSHGTLIITDYQTAGRGRRGRNWSVEQGKDIACSIVLKPQLEPAQVPMLTLLSALAVVRGVEDTLYEYGIQTKEGKNSKLQIKWPNDIVYQKNANASKKKICGILTEANTDMDGISYVIIGIGMNVNKTMLPDEIKDMATSFMIEEGITIHRAKLVVSILYHLEQLYDTFITTKNMNVLKKEYESYLANYEQEVKVIGGNVSLQGICKGITETGDLVIEDVSGNRTTICSGEVSIRGMYGYT